jgi:PAS domain S-box-containing protein
MAIGYLRSRVFATAALAASGLFLALLWTWQQGWVVAVAALAVMADAVWRLRSGSHHQVLTPLLFDVTVTGLAVLLGDLPHVVVVAPFFYHLISAVFTLSRRISLVVGAYVACWALTVIRLDPVIAGSALSRTQQDVTIGIAVVVYLAATYLMTATAASAVQERRRLNDALREKESRLQAVVDSTPIVLYAIDSDGVFTLSEGPGLRLIGLEPGQVVGLNVADVYEGYPEVLAMVSRALESDQDTLEEVTVDGVDFAVHHRPHVDSAGARNGTVGVAIDVTVEATYRRELEEQIRSRDEFVASVSHELRTPLSVVYGLGEELRLRGGGFAPDELAELHTLLAQQAGEVVAIVEDLLVAARADIESLVVVSEWVDVADQVSSVVQPMAAEHSVEVVAADRPVEAWCDGPRFRQILRNLLTNATRHGGDRVRVSYAPRGDRIAVEVLDDGDGVPRHEESRIFDAYHRASQASGNPASIGLGLTVARKLAHLMDGELAYSRRDGWSVFTLTLPAAPGADENHLAASVTPTATRR